MGGTESRIVLLLISTAHIVSAEDVNYCEGGSHKDGEPFVPDDQCYSFFYKCANEQQYKYDCPPGTSFETDSQICDWTSSVTACVDVNKKSCTDDEGNPVNIPPFTKPETCNQGVYYTCSGGVENEKNCPDGLIYDPTILNCNWDWAVPNCALTATTKIGSTSATRDTKSTTTTTTSSTTSKFTTSTQDNAVPDCSVGDHCDGMPFVQKPGCYPYYYLCVDGSATRVDCPEGEAYDSSLKSCCDQALVTDCTSLPPNCTDKEGRPVLRPPFAKPEDCNKGIYYKCKDGKEIKKSCPDGEMFDPTLDIPGCNWAAHVDDCSATTTKAPTTSTTIPAKKAECGEDGYSNGELFIPDHGCYTYFYQCAHGEAVKIDCKDELVFDPSISVCQHSPLVEACNSLPLKCTDNNGIPVPRPPFGLKEDCKHGVYYSCDNGNEIQHQCKPGYVFDTTLTIPSCNLAVNVAQCWTDVPELITKGVETY